MVFPFVILHSSVDTFDLARHYAPMTSIKASMKAIETINRVTCLMGPVIAAFEAIVSTPQTLNDY